MTERTCFTFFPEDDERQRIQVADPVRIVEYMTGDSSMIPFFLHELWRNGREREMHEVMSRMDPRILKEGLLGHNMVSSLGVAHTFQQEPIASCRDFLGTAITLAEKAINGIPHDEPLGEGMQDELDRVADLIIFRVKTDSISFKARLN